MHSLKSESQISQNLDAFLKPIGICYLAEWPYSADKKINSSSGISGLLIKARFYNGDLGYSCLHTWPSLGDPLLTSFCQSNLDDLLAWQGIQNSLAFAKMDAEARRNGIDLHQGIRLPSNHFLISASESQARLKRATQDGFQSVKLKCNPNSPDQSGNALRIAQFCQDIGLKLRLDFNSQGSIDSALKLIGSLKSITEIEWVEDPLTYDKGCYERLRNETDVPIALDFEFSEEKVNLDVFDFVVLKPARDRVSALIDFSNKCQKPLIVTNYLEHIYGGAIASRIAFEVTKKATVVGYGLANWCHCHNDIFEKRISNQAGNISYPHGTGFGFDEELSQLDWKTVYDRS